MTFSQVVSSHVASPLFPPFGIPGRCTLTLTLARDGGRTARGEETRKVSRGISHPSRRLEFHCDSNILQKKNVSATSHIFETDFNGAFVRRGGVSFFTSIVRR